jgi:hypothetical protein
MGFKRSEVRILSPRLQKGLRCIDLRRRPFYYAQVYPIRTFGPKVTNTSGQPISGLAVHLNWENEQPQPDDSGSLTPQFDDVLASLENGTPAA